MPAARRKAGILNGARLAMVVLAVNFLVFVANLYLSNGYVSRTTYDADIKDALTRREALTETLNGIAVELRGIKDHMENAQEQKQRIDKLDERMREIEKGGKR